MFCGAGSLRTLDDVAPTSAPGTPRQQKRRKPAGGKSNPYSSRGLDKFSTVLTELESRKEKIIASTAGSDDRHHVLVRFKHTGSCNDWVPIVVRLPDDHRKENMSTSDLKGSGVSRRDLRKTVSMPTSPQPLPAQAKDESHETSGKAVEDGNKKAETKRGIIGYDFFRLSFDRTRPRSYWPWVGVIVLISLVFFGRAFAVCCTSIWWYLVPTLIGEDPDTLRITRNTNQKKILRKRAQSDEKIGGRINITPASSSSSPSSPSSSSPRVLPSSSNNKEKPKRLCSF